MEYSSITVTTAYSEAIFAVAMEMMEFNPDMATITHFRIILVVITGTLVCESGMNQDVTTY